MPPWVPLFRAALDRNRRRRHVQVATASRDAGPSVRTVVLRELTEDGTAVFFTDTRSEKVSDLRADPRVEIHGWWPKGHEQFRLRGEASISTRDDDPVRNQLWQTLHEDDLARFYAGPPGHPLSEGPGPSLDAIPSGIAPTFAVVRVRPSSVDRLVLDPAGHTRERFARVNGVWIRTEIQP